MRAILTYHSIDDSDSPISVPEPVFRRHIEWLAARGPRVVPVDELTRLPGAESAVAITFDDAFVNFAELAWPLLREYGLPVTLYVPTAHVGGTNDWAGSVAWKVPRLPILDWNRLGRLSAEGVTMGSHTCTHPNLTRLPDASLEEELVRSAEQISTRLGVRAAGLAYPYGVHDDRAARIASRIYDHACTTELRCLSAGDLPHRLPRLDMYYLRGNGRLETWGTARLRLYLRARANARRCRELLMVATNVD